jgi:hypothetical protein
MTHCPRSSEYPSLLPRESQSLWHVQGDLTLDSPRNQYPPGRTPGLGHPARNPRRVNRWLVRQEGILPEKGAMAYRPAMPSSWSLPIRPRREDANRSKKGEVDVSTALQLARYSTKRYRPTSSLSDKRGTHFVSVCLKGVQSLSLRTNWVSNPFVTNGHSG